MFSQKQSATKPGDSSAKLSQKSKAKGSPSSSVGNGNSKSKAKNAPSSPSNAKDEKNLSQVQNVVRLPCWPGGESREVNALTFRALAGLGVTGTFLVLTLLYHYAHSPSSTPSFDLSSRGAAANTNPDLSSFLSDIPPAGYAFAASTVAGVVAMAVRVKTRRDDRRHSRYMNGLKVAAIVSAWIVFMMVRTFSRFLSPSSREEEEAAAVDATLDRVKAVLGGSTFLGLGYLAYTTFCPGGGGSGGGGGRRRGRRRRRHRAN